MIGNDPRRLAWWGLAALALTLGIDFHFDVHERDVFDWMDPYQYYEFALAVFDGREHFTRFEVPTIFPFLLMPALAIDDSIASALWTNFVFTLLLLGIIRGLCRELGLATPAAVVALLTVSSPLLLGLSRTAYIEFALTAVVAGALLLWLRFLRKQDFASGIPFAAVVALGLLLKLTFPLFLLLPVGAVLIQRVRGAGWPAAAPIVMATALPITAVLAFQASFFPTSFAYITSLGNTSLPIMRLIGPPDSLSFASVSYYFGELGRTLLGLLTPFLAVVALASLPRLLRLRVTDLATPDVTLWLWLLGPLLLLSLQPVQEPRHVAPCVVPAVLLTVRGIESYRRSSLRLALTGAAVAAALLQYVAITRDWIEVPYFLDRSLHWGEVSHAMVAEDLRPHYGPTPEDDRAIHWKYDHNVVLVDFPANEALAFTWHLFPGITFDLTTLEDPARLADGAPTGRFEDLFLLAAFNTYNRRAGWRHYYATLPLEAVVANADFVLVNDTAGDDPAVRFPEHVLAASIVRREGVIRVLRSRSHDAIPFRALFAAATLRDHPDLSDDERDVVQTEWLQSLALAGDEAGASALLQRNPRLRHLEPARNIYWIAGYETIARLARARFPDRPAP